MRRLVLLLASVAFLVAVATAIAAAAFPERIDLPNAFRPEGIAAKGKTLYVGSIPTGEVRRVDAKSGDVDPLVPARAGRAAIGLKIDERRRLFVAGGPTGKAFVYDARDGDDLAQFQLATWP
jgi:sugar lactone lactonase YvrE